MIVKNEAKIIKRLLLSTINIIDSFVIIDTGSTDNTIEIIKDFFSNYKNIKGILGKKDFVNFQVNRNHALNLCRGISDYILLLDADFYIKIGKNFDKNKLDKDAYLITQQDNNFVYQNVRLIKNIGSFFYIGATHEVIQNNNQINVSSLDKNILYVEDIGDGGSKDNKLERDIKLLKQDIKEYPNVDRFKFYLAGTYFNSELFELAEKYYKERIEMNGWKEEVYYSYYKIGLIKIIEKDYDKAIMNFLNAHENSPKRVECLYYLVEIYKVLKKDNLYKLFNDIYIFNVKNYEDDIFLFKEIQLYNII
jgi:glycosyltransferase involved in cell wall biosynthesis